MIEKHPAREFTCPRCGSHYFGTDYVTEPKDKWLGYCNGAGCTFTWKRIDDPFYFKTRPDSGVHKVMS